MVRESLHSTLLDASFLHISHSELLHYDAFLSNFPLLKSPQKIYHHDRMWKYTCERLDWEFIATGLEDDTPR